MQNIWLIIGVTAGAIVLGLPVGAIVLVSLASLREESAHSLTREAPGPASRAARRLLGYRTEVRFAHATRAVPDPGQYRPGDQSEPGSIGADRRIGAGV